MNGAPTKSDEGHVELAPQEPDRVEGERQRLARLEGAEGVDVALASNRIVDPGALSRDEVETDAEGVERHEQIGEQDRRIDAQAPNRLKRDLRRELGRSADVEERVPLADFLVLRHVATRLAHEPPPACAASGAGDTRRGRATRNRR